MDRRNNFKSFIYGQSSTNPVHFVKIGPVDVEIILIGLTEITKKLNKDIAPRAARRYAPRRWQLNSRRIYVRPRTGPQSAPLWWLAVAKLQAANVPIG